MKIVPIGLGQYEPIDMPDGIKLDERQTAAVYLATVDGKSNDQIAKLTGYASGQSVSQFLRSKKGRIAVEAVVRAHLSEAAAIGLRTMIELARKAKSENVRQLAAADLLNRAGMTVKPDQARDPARGSGLSININIGGQDQPVTIEGEAVDNGQQG